MIPYGKQWIDEEDINAVVSVLRGDWLTQGPLVEQFEKAVAGHCGARYAVAVSSGTAALHIACLAAGIKRDDEVITSPITFVASANCTVYCNAKPVFADIDLKTYNIMPSEIERKINSRTKAVIPVHFAGQSCDMASIHAIVKSAEQRYGHRIFIIEDACHALGSLYNGQKVGSGAYSDVTVMSFHPVKHITTGEGGMALTNDETLYKRLKQYRSHGITTTKEEFVNLDLAFQPTAPNEPQLQNPWYYEQVTLGYNYRLTDIQSALGVSQLKKLDKYRIRRKEIVNIYNTAFKRTKSITIPFEDTNCNSNFHLYVLLFDFDKMNTDRACFMLKLKSRGVQTQVHYIPVYLQPYYRKLFGTNNGDCPNAENYYKRCLSIPLFPAMTAQDVDKVIEAVAETIEDGKK
jgi:perosamine synthetase